jgi:diguanylate cyclase (GGDEF)-like protein
MGGVKNSSPSSLNTTAQRVHAIAERYRLLVEQSGMPLGEAKLCLTISAGATIAAPGEDLEAVIKRADTLLYESKAAGRNRVTAR